MDPTIYSFLLFTILSKVMKNPQIRQISMPRIWLISLSERVRNLAKKSQGS